MIKSNFKDVISGVSDKIINVAEGEYRNILRTVATSLNAFVATRIHEQGEDANGGKIGSYDTKPIYVNPLRATRGFSVGGKTGKTVFISTKQPHKTKYFEGGYNEFKTAVGKNELGSVNLNLSGQMQNQFTVIETSNGFGLGWSNEEILKRAFSFERKKYGKQIWALTEKENEQAKLIATENLLDAIS